MNSRALPFEKGTRKLYRQEGTVLPNFFKSPSERAGDENAGAIRQDHACNAERLS